MNEGEAFRNCEALWNRNKRLVNAMLASETSAESLIDKPNKRSARTIQQECIHHHMAGRTLEEIAGLTNIEAWLVENYLIMAGIKP